MFIVHSQRKTKHLEMFFPYKIKCLTKSQRRNKAQNVSSTTPTIDTKYTQHVVL